MTLRYQIGGWLAVLLSATAAFSQQVALDLNTATTKINWTLNGNVHTVHGTFQLKQGHLKIDSASGAVSGELVVDAASGDSGNASRDKRMNKEVLEVEKYPEVRLVVTKIEGATPLQNSLNVRVEGRLNIRGANHDVSVPMQVSIEGDQFSGRGKFVVPYVDWGMKDPSNFLFKVNKTVEIEVVAAGKVTR
jgi:polyisoprenoid-binding protein YceI